MKKVLTSVLAMATIAIMMTSSTSAFGQSTPNTHAVDPVPLLGFANDPFAMQSIANQDPGAGTADIYESRIFVLYDPDLGASVPNNPLICENYAPLPGDRLWELQNTATGVDIEGSHDNIGTAGSSIFYDQTAATGPSGAAGDGFGNGAAAANPDTIGTATLYNLNANPLLNNWVEHNAAGNPIVGNFDSTAQAGQYTLVVCGWVDTIENGVFDGVGSEVGTTETRGFLVQAEVGGEMMPISATSLLVAGASANALWILPILGLAGTVIAIRKLEA